MVSAMSALSRLQSFSSKLRKFSAADRGNVVMTFALATVPMMGFVGSAVDYSRANSAKAAMQAAVDATALMLSKSASSMTTAQINQKALDYFNANFNRTEVTSIQITPTFTTSGGSQIVVTGAGVVPTTFMKVMGMSGLNINVSSTVKWGNTRLRVALVLDNTGSMADNGKITALKTATNNLLTQLKNAASQNGDVYVSIIPFSKDVNVGDGNYNASWIDWTDWDNNNGTCSGGWGWGGNTKSSCQGSGKNWTPDDHSTWNGCVTDRGNKNTPTGQDYDTNANPPINNNPQSQFPAEQYGSCPQAVMPLSYNWSGMTMLVNNMSPGGNTNQAIGLAHGWMSLVGGGPYPTPPAMDPNYTYQQVIILLTDGLNTQDRWYTNQASIDARQQLTCANIKAAGITLYTIQVNTSGDPTSTLLQNCATDTSKFFLLTSANQIVTTFNQIGTALSNLRVAK
jgi:Flp pilus assembly protein TadG